MSKLAFKRYVPKLSMLEVTPITEDNLADIAEKFPTSTGLVLDEEGRAEGIWLRTGTSTVLFAHPNDYLTKDVHGNLFAYGLNTFESFFELFDEEEEVLDLEVPTRRTGKIITATVTEAKTRSPLVIEEMEEE